MLFDPVDIPPPTRRRGVIGVYLQPAPEQPRAAPPLTPRAVHTSGARELTQRMFCGPFSAVQSSSVGPRAFRLQVTDTGLGDDDWLNQWHRLSTLEPHTLRDQVLLVFS